MSSDERIIIRPSVAAYGDYYLFSVLIMLLGIFLIHSLAVVIIGGIAFLFTEALRRAHRYILTEDTLRVQFRFLSWNEVSISYRQIQNIRIEQDIVDRSIHTGTLFIDTAGTHSNEIVFQTIPYPEKVKEIIEERMKGEKR